MTSRFIAFRTVKELEGGKTNRADYAAVFQIQIGHLDGAARRLSHIRVNLCREPSSLVDDDALHEAVFRSINLRDHEPAKLNRMNHCLAFPRRTCQWAACVQNEWNQRASLPPSTEMDAPVMKDALSDATNIIV